MPSSQVMHKWKAGKLHSGSKSGPVVKDQSQAIAIMMSEKRKEKKQGGKYHMKRGGKVTGGVKGKDSVHILAEPGEHMMTTKASQMVGHHTLDAINDAASRLEKGSSYSKPRRMQKGGKVDPLDVPFHEVPSPIPPDKRVIQSADFDLLRHRIPMPNSATGLYPPARSDYVSDRQRPHRRRAVPRMKKGGRVRSPLDDLVNFRGK